ncbi:hypothetical protein MIMGU_mgv1a008121mg [Erythranthe guttata]|uniref:Peptidase A1 domain-containing protein n=1 Tax=Erythranthe guttata TaxID=4155 RepID=A0A022RN96_ERYGU|nr:hypothetical protein MIMGU_mgv1a008121mg [Erythranthe guttata]
MASSSSSSLQFLLFLTLLSLTSSSFSQNPILPKAAILPLKKDPTTLQYIATVFMGGTLAAVELVVDINGGFVWVDCESNPTLRSHEPIKSCSLKCSMAKNPVNGCHSASKNCLLHPENTVSRMSVSGDLNEDRVAMEFWERNIGSRSLAKIENFLFSCAPNLLMKGLASGAKGMLGLGNSRISFPSQFSTEFGFFRRKFSLRLSSSKGSIFFGGSPYDESSMVYTPLTFLKNGFFLQDGYYINVGSIKVSGKKVSLQRKGLPFKTKLTSAMNMTRVSAVAPFEVCFGSKGVGNIPDVPIVDLVLQSEMVRWRIHGRNSMVDVGDGVFCLGFLDGGLSPRDAIVLGGYQMEDYLLEFNLGNSMLGFSSLATVEKNSLSDFEALSG